jgi:hypothetical protein
MPGGPAGTRGLGLFLVLRQKPRGNSATIRIHRLKDKLGVRSMASGEITFEGTEAFLLGGIDKGFKQMAEMLNMSRLYNAVASIAGARRAILEASAYGSERKAFGVALAQLPLWRSAMADVIAEFWGMYCLVFETVRALDQSDMGSEPARRLTRLTIPMAKAITGKFAIFAVSECMEQVGGNGYIEESILPRLLRDCQVLPIWEGSTHILALDGLRAIHKEAAHEPFFARIRAALAVAGSGQETEPATKPQTKPGTTPDIAARVAAVEARLQKLEASLAIMAAAPNEAQQRDAREWLEAAARTLSLALLLEQSAHPPLREVCLAAIDRMANRPYAVAPVNCGQPSGLAHTEEALLASAHQ